MPTLWRGIFAIPVTPFLPSGQLDHHSLARQVEFCVAGGSAGLVYPGVVSEFFTLTDGERREALATVVGAADGAVPVIAGVSAPSAWAAGAATRDAVEVGVAGVMATLPYVQHFFTPDVQFVDDYFAEIARNCSGPIILQNARIGHVIPMSQLGDVVRGNERIRYLKEETSPSTHQLSAAVEAVGDLVDGVFAGLGGVYLMSELDRGAAGSMPAPPFVDVLARVYDLYVRGERAEARARLAALAPFFTFELLYNLGVIKELLHRRGVIDHVTSRTPVPHMDAVDRREFDELLERIDFKELAR